jgi:cell division protein FtsB
MVNKYHSSAKKGTSTWTKRQGQKLVAKSNTADRQLSRAKKKNEELKARIKKLKKEKKS